MICLHSWIKSYSPPKQLVAVHNNCGHPSSTFVIPECNNTIWSDILVCMYFMIINDKILQRENGTKNFDNDKVISLTALAKVRIFVKARILLQKWFHPIVQCQTKPGIASSTLLWNSFFFLSMMSRYANGILLGPPNTMGSKFFWRWI